MPQIEGTSRHQMQIFALEQVIAADNPVRVIDAFVSTLSLEELGFLIKGEGDELWWLLNYQHPVSIR